MAKILVVDDNRSFVKMIVDTLVYEDHEVIIAYSGTDAVRIARAQSPDIVLCDLNIPELDGYGVLEAIRSSRTTANVTFYFLTGEQNADPQSADGVIEKPFQVEHLLDRISNRLSRSA